jgi:A-factor biosynthesis hotdog domain
MSNPSIILVGDKFKQFGAQEGAVTVSCLANLLDRPDAGKALPSRILVGQGVSEAWLSYLKARAEARNLDIEFIGERPVNERTGRRFAHKHQRKNILVTDPVQSGINRYECHLTVDDDCEIMSDHTTGHHIQGMLLVEAARQAFLAVTEWYLLENNAAHYFVINRMDVNYRQFAFPVATTITFDITEMDRSRPDRVSVKALVKFMQLGACVSEVLVDYSAIQQVRLEKREAQMAQDVLQRALAAAQASRNHNQEALAAA